MNTGSLSSRKMWSIFANSAAYRAWGDPGEPPSTYGSRRRTNSRAAWGCWARIAPIADSCQPSTEESARSGSSDGRRSVDRRQVSTRSATRRSTWPRARVSSGVATERRTGRMPYGWGPTRTVATGAPPVTWSRNQARASSTTAAVTPSSVPTSSSWRRRVPSTASNVAARIQRLVPHSAAVPLGSARSGVASARPSARVRRPAGSGTRSSGGRSGPGRPMSGTSPGRSAPGRFDPGDVRSPGPREPPPDRRADVARSAPASAVAGATTVGGLQPAAVDAVVFVGVPWRTNERPVDAACTSSSRATSSAASAGSRAASTPTTRSTSIRSRALARAVPVRGTVIAIPTSTARS